MEIIRINTRSFRGLKDDCYQFGSGINIIHGANGIGKTSLLEAIALLSDGNSFRTREEEDLIRKGESFAHLDARTAASQLTHRIRLAMTEKGKKAQVDGHLIRRLSRLIGTFISVVFTPADVYFFQEAPRLRRRFIDLEISKLSLSYLDALISYRKVLREKSKLLRLGTNQRDLIEVYNQQLALYSVRIVSGRRKFLSDLEEFLNPLFLQICGKKGQVAFRYHTFIGQDDQAEQIHQRFQALMDKEILKRTPLGGVHLDDFQLFFFDPEGGQYPVSSYFSQGELRMVVLALKIALSKMMERILGEKCVMLLDDVMSEIDADKQHNLMDILADCGQVLITTVHTEFVEPGMKVQLINL